MHSDCIRWCSAVQCSVVMIAVTVTSIMTIAVTAVINIVEGGRRRKFVYQINPIILIISETLAETRSEKI